MSRTPPISEHPRTVSLKVWGRTACFARPEYPTESVTYPVPTPTAAAGLVASIFGKPEFTWRTAAIDVLNPIRTERRTVNGIKTRQTGRPFTVESDRTQLSAVNLVDVAYIFHMWVELAPHATKHEVAYREQLQRRVERGEQFRQPCLGRSEFHAYFSPPTGDERPIDQDLHIGTMVHTIHRSTKGPWTPSFFDAHMLGGRIIVPVRSMTETGQ